MRYPLAIGAVALQLFVLAFMAGEREWILRTGRTVLLRTAPIDPNDPMRGDYARLDYEISHVPKNLLEGDLVKTFVRPEDAGRFSERRVYARLQTTDGDTASLLTLTDTKPSDGIFIRGRTENSYGLSVQVRYGIEALFMQQGTAKKLEEMRVHERPGVPLDIEVALSPSGVAVLKNYQWEPLGITVTFERSIPSARAERNTPDSAARQQFINAVVVELKNYGPQEVAVVDLPNAGSFRLVPNDRWQESRYRWVGENQPPPTPAAGHVLVLKPGESHLTKIDLTQSRWYVVNTLPTANKTPVALRDVTDPWSASFRIEYAPPTKAASSQLPRAELIRHGTLRSRAFNPTAGMD